MWLIVLLPFLVLPALSKANFPFPSNEEKLLVETIRNDNISYRLPANVRPELYKLSLDVDLERSNFTGSVQITLNVIENTNSITLHSSRLEIQDVRVNCRNQSDFYILEEKVEDYWLDTVTDFLTLNLSREVPKDFVCVISIQYLGFYTNYGEGFFKGEYTNKYGNESFKFAATQFEATFARQAFPCFDEPSYKAEFEITIIRSSGYTSLSNTPIVAIGQYANGRAGDFFKRTPKMSTYLIAFVVSQFGSVRSGFQSVYGRPEWISEGRGDYALTSALDNLPVLEQFMGIPYNDSMDKLDNVAIPNEHYFSGAMENWGLVIYREMYLLSKETVTTTSEKQYVNTVISHEFGHKWFGNLVSPSWWNYLWINEGFATYFEYYASATSNPTWRLMERLVVASLQSVLQTDQLASTRALSAYVETQAEIASLFTRLIYDKGVSIIRMMEHLISTPVFQNGVNKFLTKHAYDSVNEDDLWEAFEEALTEAGRTLEPSLPVIMKSWTQQAGFPLVTVNSNSGNVIITQQRFFLNSSTDEDLETIWNIPINFVTSSNVNFTNIDANRYIVTQKSENINSLTVGSGQWVIANIQQVGYFRVNYDEDNWRLLINYLNSNDYVNIHPLNRAQLVDDALVLARAGKLHYHVALDLISYLSRETDYMPIYSLITNFNYLNRVFSAASNNSLFKEFTGEILMAAFDKLTSDELTTDGHVDKLNRLQVLNILCNANDERCLRETNNKLRSWQDISPDLQSAVYCGGLRGGGEEEWNHLYNLYKSDNVEELQRTRLISALSCTENVTLLQRVHDMVFYRPIDWTFYSEKDRISLLTGLYSNSQQGLNVLINMNFDELYGTFSAGQVNTLLNGLSSRLTNKEQQDVFLRILSLENISSEAYYNNIQDVNRWIEAYEEIINDWLISHFSSTTTSSTTTTTTTTTTTQKPENGDSHAFRTMSMPILLLSSVLLLLI